MAENFREFNPGNNPDNGRNTQEKNRPFGKIGRAHV